MAVFLVSSVVRAAGAGAGSERVSADELNSAINHVIAQPEYAWRMARLKEAAPETGFWGAFFGNITEWAKRALRPLVEPLKKLGRWVRKQAEKFVDWLESFFKHRGSTGTTSSGWQTGVRLLLFGALAAALSFLVLLLLRMWRNRTRPAATTDALARPTRSDILEERVTADELPADEWMAMARQFLDNGELRLAVRAMFLGCLVYLANRDKLTIARHKSNREYVMELSRRAHDAPDVLVAFAANVGILERIWYGMHMATEETVGAFESNQETIVGTARPQTQPALQDSSR